MKKNKIAFPSAILRTSLYFLFLVLINSVLEAPSALAQQHLCVPAIGGLAGEPTIDGNVESDLGWNNAVRVNLDEGEIINGAPSGGGGTPRDAALQVGATPSYVYMSIEIGNPVPEVHNTVVIAFSTDGDPAHDWRFHIMPFDVNSTATSTSNVFPREVKYWRNSTQGGWNSQAPNPASVTAVAGTWQHDNIRYSFDKATGNWALELKIPRVAAKDAASNNGIYFPDSTPFQLYVNVLSTNDLLGTYYQDPWPAGILILPTGGFSAENNTPTPGTWSIASLYPVPECKGISLAWDGIGVEDPNPPHDIVQKILELSPPVGGYPGTDLNGDGVKDINDCANDTLDNDYQWPAQQGPLNTFIARPTNSGNASAVSAKFFIAPWGIPGVNDWRPIGSLYPTSNPSGVINNPTSELPIPGGGSVDLKAQWNLSFKQSCAYSLSNGGHHCIQVNLDSTDPNAIFLNKSMQKNMDIVHASSFSQDARISTNGFEKQEKLFAGLSTYDYVLRIDTALQHYNRDGNYYYPAANKGNPMHRFLKPIDAGYFKNGLSEAMIWTARGYVKTRYKLVIDGKPFTYAKSTGSYGYIVGHEKSGAIWSSDIKIDGRIEGFKKVGDVYTMKMGQHSAAVISSSINATDTPPPCKTPCCKQSKLSGSMLFFGTVGIGATGFGLNRRRRRKSKRVQNKV